LGEIERISFDFGRFVVFGFMGLGFLVGWWVYKRGLVVESGGDWVASGSRVSGLGMEISYQVVSKRESEEYFCTF